MSRELNFEHILTPAGIERHRRLSIDGDGRITAIEPSAPGAAFDGWLALPGMPSAHSHAFQRGLAGYGEARQGEDSFWSWRDSMYRLAAGLDPDTLYELCWHTYREMLAAGYTSVAEFHYLHRRRDGERATECVDAVIRAATDAGMRQSFIPVFYQRGGFDAPAGPAQARFLHRDAEDFLTLVAMYQRHCGGVAAHSLRAVPADMIEDMVLGAAELLGPSAPVHLHIAEQPAEVAACVAATGRRPVELLAETVELGPHWSLVHATHTDHAEQALIRASGATVVLCPLTEGYLGDGMFPAAEFAAAGGRIAIGSDSNVRIDAVEELRWLEYGQRLSTGRRGCFANAEGLGAALWGRLAAGGAAPLGLPVGALQVGSYADVVTVDAGAMLFAGCDGPHAVLDALITAGDGRAIDQVWVGGRRHVPLEGGEFGPALRRIMAPGEGA
ncbi:formimidoylglutamate deiminase [Wenzhouxiangella sp. XN24]|uniref:formimidoylglutamate deiminase n=1 Tax=Wenzhouxiangella sp. XN24 TaxID=2713569 RepID=UPI0013EC9A7A|nr:formimidoylglutamate deiminase [Wenzhouxiangella sp. XN24]NGX16912.1 formimidoylglutamate deiminase [Wenzhouxiangella sp. XN24]